MKLITTLGNYAKIASGKISADKARKVDVDHRAAKTMMIATLFLAAVIPELAVAGPWDTMGTQVLAIFTGGLTRTIAIITVIACGIAAVAGKLSWDWAIKIIVGIVLIFGATSIVDYFIAAAA
jgi:type IV secretory pathway VirB2 component (pilin)